MPGARCTRSLACKSRKHTSIHTVERSHQPSLRNGLRLIPRSPRCPGLLATVACGYCRKLDASVGASGPHVFAVREQQRSSALPPRPPHPAPNVRDDRETPLWKGRMANRIIRNFDEVKRNYENRKNNLEPPNEAFPLNCGDLPWRVPLTGTLLAKLFFSASLRSTTFSPLGRGSLEDVAGLADDVRFWKPSGHEGFVAQSPLLTHIGHRRDRICGGWVRFLTRGLVAMC